MPVTFTSPIAIGTIDAIRVGGFDVRGLYDTANAFVRLHLQLMVGATVYQDRHLEIHNGRPLRRWDETVDVQPASSWATQLFTVISTATGNPRDEIEAFLVAQGVVVGT